MPLTLAFTLTALRTALTAPATGRHRRPSRCQRAAAIVRFVIGLPPATDDPRHAARRPRTVPTTA